MEKTLLGNYPICIDKDKIRYTLDVTKGEAGKLHVVIIIQTNIANQYTTKRLVYDLKNEYEAFDEVIYILNEQINRAMMANDNMSETTLIDILIQFDKLKLSLFR